jgi:hypothetical protein
LLAGKLSSKVTPSMMCLAGMALVAIGLGLLGLLSTEAFFLDIAWRGLLAGGGIGMAFQSLPILSLSQVPHAKLGVSSGVFNTFRSQISQLLPMKSARTIAFMSLRPPIHLALFTDRPAVLPREPAPPGCARKQ